MYDPSHVNKKKVERSESACSNDIVLLCFSLGIDVKFENSGEGL